MSGKQSNHLFPELPPRENVPPYPADLGAVGGPMDGGYEHLSNITLPAGYTYFAQFVMHDLTCGDPPRLDLRSVYGDGPRSASWLYDELKPGLFRTGDSLGAGVIPDVPRDSMGRALINDPRNDHTTIVSQLHAAFIQLHNTTFLTLAGDRDIAFHESRQIILWLYQWLVVNDLLKRLVGENLVEQVLAEGSPLADRKFLPLEFTLAVGRFGHAMVKPRYRLNDELRSVILFKNSEVLQPFDDLRGQSLERRAVIDWENFFPTGHPMKAQASAKLNSKICRPLFQFPYPGARSELERSIPCRTLEACQKTGIPPGQAVASAMGFYPLSEEQLWDDLPYRGAPAPLWFYLLREAEFQQHGQRLGQVGGKILADVVIGALMSDKTSYLFQPDWCEKMKTFSVIEVGILMKSITGNRPIFPS